MVLQARDKANDCPGGRLETLGHAASSKFIE